MALFNTAFWNIQNLFDTSLSAIAADFEFTPANGWTAETKDKKIENLANIINQMFDGNGPDLLGLCEIENLSIANELLSKLNRQDLAVAHVDSPDIRGIDCSLIYSKDAFEIIGKPKEHLVHLRYPTRDIFEVALKIKENDAELVVLVNHWPSRSRGRYESEPFRITVASQCGKIVDEHLKLKRQEFLALDDTEDSLNFLNKKWNGNILIMGDLNDEPYDRSVLEELQASNGYDKIEEIIKRGQSEATHLPSISSYLKKEAYLFNCSWGNASKPDVGTHFYSQSINTMNMLDQLIISRGLLFGTNGLQLIRDSNNVPMLEIFAPEIMRTSTTTVRPKKFTFGIKADGTVTNNNGFSDHFPILTKLTTV